MANGTFEAPAGSRINLEALQSTPGCNPVVDIIDGMRGGRRPLPVHGYLVSTEVDFDGSFNLQTYRYSDALVRLGPTYDARQSNGVASASLQLIGAPNATVATGHFARDAQNRGFRREVLSCGAPLAVEEPPYRRPRLTPLMLQHNETGYSGRVSVVRALPYLEDITPTVFAVGEGAGLPASDAIIVAKSVLEICLYRSFEYRDPREVV